MALVIPLSACSLLPQEEPVLAPPLVEPAKIDYEVVEVKKGDVIKRVKGLGTVEPAENRPLAFSQSGTRLKKISVKKGELVKKGQLIAEIESGSLAFDLELAEIDLKKAEIKLKQLNAQNADTYSIDLAELDLDSLQLRVEHLKNELEKTRITSPINGIVTFITEKNAGDAIEAYESIVHVADTSKLQLVYSAISGNELVDTKIGMKAEITINGKKTAGKVVQTPSEVPVEKIEENPDLYQRSIFIAIENPPKDVKVGDSIDFEIITGKRENVLIIPKSALRSMAGRDYVQVLEGEAKREIDIEKGLVSDTEVEVIRGLETGDTVILK
ncbi:hypothetical protein WQ54_00995 [Bacillus sp. SA1-12]|nr:hypothetical protein WQ54_00995 [Bacillus sp. SA1-12]